MQDMQSAACGARQAQHPLGAHPSGFCVAPYRMGCRLAALCKLFARDHAVFVFGMDCHPALARLQHGENIVLLVEQQGAGGGTQECLDATDAGHLFQFRQGADILRRGARIEGMVAMHAPFGAREFVLNGGTRGGGRCAARRRLNASARLRLNASARRGRRRLSARRFAFPRSFRSHKEIVSALIEYMSALTVVSSP